MMFAFERLPLASEATCDFRSLLCRVKAPAWAHLRLEEIEEQRRAFQAFFSALQVEKQRLSTPDELRAQASYLVSTYDLLAIGVQGSFSPTHKYASLLAKGEEVVVAGDLRFLLFAEFVFARYVFALGTICAAQRRFTRFVATHKQSQAAREEWKLIYECFVLGLRQLGRLYKHKVVVWALPSRALGLPIELSTDVLELLWRVAELNFAVLLVWGSLYHMPTTPDLSGQDLATLCMNSLAKSQEVDAAIHRFPPSALIAHLHSFQHFATASLQMSLHLALLAGNAEAEGEYALGSRRDLLAQLHWDRALIGEQLLHWRGQMERLKPAGFARCLKRFWSDMSETARVREALHVYPALKGDIGAYLPQAPTLQAIYDRTEAPDLLGRIVLSITEESEDKRA